MKLQYSTRLSQEALDVLDKVENKAAWLESLIIENAHTTNEHKLVRNVMNVCGQKYVVYSEYDLRDIFISFNLVDQPKKLNSDSSTTHPGPA